MMNKYRSGTDLPDDVIKKLFLGAQKNQLKECKEDLKLLEKCNDKYLSNFEVIIGIKKEKKYIRFYARDDLEKFIELAKNTLTDRIERLEK